MPLVSVIIISYNMAREVPRTVTSFLPPYQKNLRPEDVEVIVIENGSSIPIPETVRSQWPDTVKYVNLEDAHPSPAIALNLGASMASAPVVCPVIDGARMASPGLLHWGLKTLRGHDRTIVSSVGFHLGKKLQQFAVEEGYNQDEEDALLASINWPARGYKLFEICALAGSSKFAWFGQVHESNAPLVPKSLYTEIGGFDEAFDIPGGGLVNLDFLNRLVDAPDTEYFALLGEGTFHQFHGGVTTSRPVNRPEADGITTWEKYAAQYRRLRGYDYRAPSRQPTFCGHFPIEASKIMYVGLFDMMKERGIV
ncbi:MAG: glycosyltransferase [Pseudomonadota bacterium]